MKYIFIILLCLTAFTLAAQPLQTNIPAHDQVMIQQDSVNYVFCTGFGISMWSSINMKDWKPEKPVFNKPPQWAVEAIPGFKGHTWAPDISFHNGQDYLYYAVSAFGKNTSCIGLAVNKTLNTASPDYQLTDLGKIIQSVPGRDMWNAIDPNLITEDNGTAWLSFGSFWNGIKLVKLAADLKAVAQPQQWFTIASRKLDPILPDSVAGDAAIEAPFIFKKGKYFYLFVSFDYCCRAEKSTYKVVVGRSEKIAGPYADRDGVPMNLGGGSLVLEGDKNWFGAGHNSVYTFNGREYIIFHGYDAADKGRSKLRIENLDWDAQGWPFILRK